MMNSKRFFYVMLGALGILVLAIIGSAYVANMMLSQRAKTLSDLKLQNEVLNQEKTSLAQAKKDLAKYDLLDTIAKTIVPQDKDQAEVVNDIVIRAADNGFKPSAITLPSSNLGQAVAGAAAAATAKPDLSQLTPVKGANGLYTMEIVVSQNSTAPVTFAQFISFLSALENNRRTALVTSVVLQPSPTDGNLLSFTLTLNKYIKP
jgi:hypothetical protein